MVVDEISPAFGECVVMLQAVGIKQGYLIALNSIPHERVRGLIKGTVVGHYPLVDDNPVALRESLIREAEAIEVAVPVIGEGRIPCSIPVDNYFPVKGIGIVVLGGVTSGVLLSHDTLQVLPKEVSAVVRLIQKHDDSVGWAVEGDRVGLALKNIYLGDMDRGHVLTNDTAISVVSSCLSQAILSPYWQIPLRLGMVVHIGHWMQFLPARILEIDEHGGARSPILTLALEKPLVHPPSATAVLCHLEGKKLRVAGTILLPRHRII